MFLPNPGVASPWRVPARYVPLARTLAHASEGGGVLGAAGDIRGGKRTRAPIDPETDEHTGRRGPTSSHRSLMFAPYRHVPMFVAHQGPKPVFVRTHNDEAFWRRAFSVLLLSVLFPKLALAVLSIPILAIAAFTRFTMLMMLVAAGASVLSGVAGFFCSGRRRSASACPCWRRAPPRS